MSILMVRHEVVKAQIASLLTAWGMAPDQVETTSTVMADADLRGIDTHGISMMPVYDERRRNNTVTIDAKVAIVAETPVSVLVDGGGGLGYVPSVMAMNRAISIAKAGGVCVAAVRNSNHFGAAGYYTRMAAEQGVIGMSATSASAPRVVPTFGAEQRLGTDPISFAAPARRNPPFVLDMATSTVASGKIRNAATEGREIPIGWMTDRDGRPTTNAREAYYEGGMHTPLGGTPELSSHKGYGLAAMVNILTTCLAGGSLVTAPDHPHRTPGSMELAHFFLAIDPGLFRERSAFEDTLDQFIDDLHATKPVDPAQPVLVAGDPEEKKKQTRLVEGIPVPPGLAGKIQGLAEAAGVPYLLAG